ncbi:hypothetical protein B0H14DRAFT_3174145 [Mycena olivaceomarginata]|nr:hypothetical protein B0H14DRAFT_3174145 [Mycena olivaceomarginata]
MLCTPASRLDILIFFLANYIAHAVTVKPYPGESSTGRHINFLTALLFPTLGLVRGLNAWARHAIFTKGSLERAARSGALCVVVRNEQWEPEDGFRMHDIRLIARSRISAPSNLLKTFYARGGTGSPILGPDLSGFSERPLDLNERSLLRNDVPTVLTTYVPVPSTDLSLFWLFPDTHDFYINLRTVHGAYRLPSGYSLAHVPRDAQVRGMAPELDVELSSGYSIPKATAGLVQAIYSAFTLYSARGAQIHQYGYASFGLTVLPYTVMTVVNFIGNLLTPDYPTLYLVESDVLLEAQKRPGALFEGVVGKLVPVDRDASSHLRETAYRPQGYWRGFARFLMMLGRGHRDFFRGRYQPRLSGKFNVTLRDGDETQLNGTGCHPRRRLNIDLDLKVTSIWGSEAVRRGGEDHDSSGIRRTNILLLHHLLRKSPRNLPDSHICIQIPACPHFRRHSDDTPSLGLSLWSDEVVVLDIMGTGFATMAVFFVNLTITATLAFLSEGFSPGDSTKAQRGWTMSWFAAGAVLGVVFSRMRVDIDSQHTVPKMEDKRLSYFAALMMENVKSPWAAMGIYRDPERHHRHQSKRSSMIKRWEGGGPTTKTTIDTTQSTTAP